MIQTRTVRTLAVAAALLAATLVGAALAQDAASPDGAGDGLSLVSSSWTVGCRPAGEQQAMFCEASQILSVEGTGQTFVAVQVTPWERPGQPRSLALRLQLPHGMSVPAGVVVSVDDQPAASPEVQTSGPGGIFARAELTEPLLAAMTQGSTMTIAFAAVTGQEFNVSLPLDGFAAAHQKVVSQ